MTFQKKKKTRILAKTALRTSKDNCY